MSEFDCNSLSLFVQNQRLVRCNKGPPAVLNWQNWEKLIRIRSISTKASQTLMLLFVISRLL